jgi:hypothetical protein
MSMSKIARRSLLGLLPVLLGARGAAAHHGWSWAEGDQTELRGTIREVFVGQPHPSLRVETPSDGVWTVELANPSQTARAGFTTASAAPGDEVLALGNRSRTASERRIKAVRITVRGRTYDLYPERIRPS